MTMCVVCENPVPSSHLRYESCLVSIKIYNHSDTPTCRVADCDLNLKPEHILEINDCYDYTILKLLATYNPNFKKFQSFIK